MIAWIRENPLYAFLLIGAIITMIGTNADSMWELAGISAAQDKSVISVEAINHSDYGDGYHVIDREKGVTCTIYPTVPEQSDCIKR